MPDGLYYSLLLIMQDNEIFCGLIYAFMAKKSINFIFSGMVFLVFISVENSRL